MSGQVSWLLKVGVTAATSRHLFSRTADEAGFDPVVNGPCK